jgi:hypothetical protein
MSLDTCSWDAPSRPGKPTVWFVGAAAHRGRYAAEHEDYETIDAMRRWLEKRGEAAIDAIVAYIALRLLVIAALFTFDSPALRSLPLWGLSAVIAALILVSSAMAISTKNSRTRLLVPVL